MNSPRAKRPTNVVWLRPEYQDRLEELVAVDEVARIAGANPRSVLNWRRQYEHFPEPVKEEYIGPQPTRYFVAVEVVAWLLEHRPSLRDLEPERLRHVLRDYDGEVAELALQLSHLRSVRSQIQRALDPAADGDVSNASIVRTRHDESVRRKAERPAVDPTDAPHPQPEAPRVAAPRASNVESADQRKSKAKKEPRRARPFSWSWDRDDPAPE